MPNVTKINTETFAAGAMAEKLNVELQKVMENIYDPNTDPKKARKVTLTLTLKPDENREIIGVGVDTKCSLAPSKGVSTTMFLGTDNAGKVVGRELASGTPGQTYFGDDGVLRNDEGLEIESEIPAFVAEVTNIEDAKKVKYK